MAVEGMQPKLVGGSIVRGALLTATTILLAGAGSMVVSIAAAQAQMCSNITEQIRGEQPHATQLPDCRAYEQVSPVQKNGVDAVGSVDRVQASPSGEGVSFFAVAPFPGTVGSAAIPTYLGRRSADGSGWSTQGVEPLTPPGTFGQVVGLTDDLTKAIVLLGDEQIISCDPALLVCATHGEKTAYVGDNPTGAFQLLTANLGEPRKVYFTDATPGGRQILFETNAQLPASNAAPAAGNNLYEWDESKPHSERVSLVGVLPGGEAVPAGSFAGAGGSAARAYTQNTISPDGSRIFFTDAETGRIYMREPNAEPAVTVPVSAGGAQWQAATPDSSFVFYAEGGELHRFNADTNEDHSLTVGAEEVLGTLGVSDDGSYAYFVATGELAVNENANEEKAVKGNPNLYEWHNGVITFIADLPDADNWAARFDEVDPVDQPAGGERSSRVTPDGESVLFTSTSRLTSYDNNSRSEVYVYDAARPLSSGNPACVSCNPLQPVPTGKVQLTFRNEAVLLSPGDRNSFMTRNLSSDGTRAFFQTDEELVPEDKNEQVDVYEWEREGTGACEHISAGFSEVNGGCLYLISTGQSTEPSYFGDASVNGDDAFFFTRQSLVSQDQDKNGDIYDARVEGGIPAQNPPLSQEPCSGITLCHTGESSSTASVFAAPPSTTFSGPGNPAPPPPKGTPAQIRAERLHRALQACRSKPRSKRRACEATARRRYGPHAKPKPRAKKSASRGGRS